MPDLQPAGPDRRKWLVGTFVGTLVASGIALLYPVLKFLQPRRGGSGGAAEVVAPYRVSDLRPGGEGQWPSPFNFGGKPCLLIRTPEDEIRAFNAVCTHVDCTVEYRPDKGDIFCNCHNGVYDLMGKNVSGPPPRPLEEYDVTLQGDLGQEEIRVSRRS